MDTKALDFRIFLRTLPRKLLESLLRGIAIILIALIVLLAMPTFSRLQAGSSDAPVEVSSPPPGPPEHKEYLIPLSINRDEEPMVQNTGRNPVLRL